MVVETTPTTNYGWGKPNENADADNWGADLNTLIDHIDDQMHTVANAATAAATSAGQKLAISGNLSDLGSLPSALANLRFGGVSGGGGWGGNWAIKLPIVTADSTVLQVIVQGGVVSGVTEGASPVTLVFPTPFPTACWGVYPTTRLSAFSSNSDCWAQLIETPFPTSCRLAAQQANNNPAIDIAWIAIGI
jgi:hypothetical protein